MTINEVEHAIRSLIVSQPMITASPIGGTITSYLSIIDSFKNFKLSIQSYPAQDSFKYISFNECQRLENSISVAIFQSLQEKGLNIVAYLHSDQSVLATNPYSSMQPTQNPSMMGAGPMAYNQPMQPIQPNAQQNQMWQYQQQYAQSPEAHNPQPQYMPNRTMGGLQKNVTPNGPGMYSKPNQHLNSQSVYNPQFSDSWKKTPSQNPNLSSQYQNNNSYPNQAPTQNMSGFNQSTMKKSPKLNEVEMMQPATSSRPKPTMKSESVTIQTNKPSLLEPDEEIPEEGASSKAAGRDYLLKLLKNK